jgi:hypothetical protein
MNIRLLPICLTLACSLTAWAQPGPTTAVCTAQAKVCLHNCGGGGTACFNQCMERSGCEGPTPTPTPTPAGLLGAMDVLPHTVKAHTGIQTDRQWDDNNFLRNPVWRWAKDQNGAIPDLCSFCPCDSEESYQWKVSPTCTGQSVFSDSSSLCGYHMNWFPIEYEGFIDWGGKSPFYEDNDYTFSIHRDRGSINDRALETTARTGVHFEFDSSETVNHFDGTNTWWDDFHHNAVDKSDDAANQAVNDHFAMVIGLLGIDSQHDAHSEIHPVYAIFIKRPGLQPNEDRWAFFVRNFGNEGFCGSDEPTPNTQLQVRIPGTGSAIFTGTNRAVLSQNNVHPFSDNDLNRCADNTQWSSEPTTDGGLLFTFNLSGPANRCGFVGDLTVHWQHPEVEPSPSTSAARSMQEPIDHEVEDPVLREKIAKLDPTARQQLETQIAELRGPQVNQPAGPAKEPSRPLPQVKHPPVNSTLPNYGKGLKPVKDPATQAREEKKRQIIDAFLKAHGIE